MVTSYTSIDDSDIEEGFIIGYSTVILVSVVPFCHVPENVDIVSGCVNETSPVADNYTSPVYDTLTVSLDSNTA